MEVGLLWYDPDPKWPLERKIEQAAARYLEKFGVNADTCHVHPEDLAPHPRLRVVPDARLGHHYLWVGSDAGLPQGLRATDLSTSESAEPAASQPPLDTAPL